MWFQQILRLSIKVLLVLVLILAIAEGILRLSPSGNNFSLFTETSDNSEFLELNKGFALRYGPNENISAPFRKNKDKNTLRIFVIGEPVNNQVPNNPNASFSHMLNRYLQRSLPDKNIELVNVGFASSNSFTQYDIIRQLHKYNADIVLICPGRDEFNTPCTPGNIWLKRNLSRSHIVQLFKNPGRNPAEACSKDVEVNKHVFKRSIASFERNLNDMVVSLQDKGIRVLLMNTSSNMLDIPPRISCFTAPDSVHLKILFEKGKAAYFKNDGDLAYSCLSKVYQKDKAHAETLYYLGKLAIRENDIKTAKKYLKQAVEADKLMSRSPAEINRVIFETATIHGVPLIDIERTFSVNSVNGIPGNNLFAGPQQANLYGNVLIARECFRALIKENFIKTAKDAEAFDLALTLFDTAYDNICFGFSLPEYTGTFSLKIDSQITSGSFEEKTVSLFADKKASWEESMNKLYDYYIANKNYRQAFKIIENLAIENPYNVTINNKASIAASFLGDSQLVVHYAKKVYKMEPCMDVAQRLFLNYLKLDMPENALPYLEYARKNKIIGNDLNLIYSATCQIIDLKKHLYKYPEDKTIRRKIAEQYYEMGNDEIALLYTEPPTRKGFNPM